MTLANVQLIAAIPILLSRVEKAQEATKTLSAAREEEYTMDLVVDLLHTCMDCKGAFSLYCPGSNI